MDEEGEEMTIYECSWCMDDYKKELTKVVGYKSDCDGQKAWIYLHPEDMPDIDNHGICPIHERRLEAESVLSYNFRRIVNEDLGE